MDNPFVICRASAGSGKTFTLVKEYLKMAFAGGEEEVERRFRSILAITFTNKAAAEMKTRLMDHLSVMGAGADAAAASPMGDAILKDCPSLTPALLSRMALRLHSAILHHYTDLSVSTIDSFMHRVVRTFAHDLGKPMNFDVVLDQQRMIDDAVASLMSLAGTEGQRELTEVLQAFADSRMEDDKGYNIERLIAHLAKQLFHEDVEAHLADLSRLTLSDFGDIHRRYTAEVRGFESELRRQGAAMVEALHAAGLDEESCAYGRNGFYGYFCKLRDGVVAAPTARTLSAFGQQRLTGTKAPAVVKAMAEAAAPDLTRRFDELAAYLDAGLVRYNTCRALLRNLYSMALLGLLDRQMQALARDNETVHLSEFNRLINNVIQAEGDQAPFIYERLGSRYRHFLIDEFQDTSVLQWHNLVPLMENGVSQGCESLVVGDGKQAIYRFRQGDVRQFTRLPDVDGMEHHGRVLSLPGNYRFSPLDTNRRTGSAVVEFNNDLFSWLVRTFYADNALAQQLYVGTGADGQPAAEGDEVLRQKASKPFAGRVSLQFVGRDEADGDDVRQAVYERVRQTIEDLHDERGYRYGDICILARGNAELAAIGDYLARHGGVPQTSTESFYLRSSHAVMAVVAVLRQLYNRADRVAQADLDYRLRALGISAAPDLDYLAALDLYDCCEEAVRQLRLDGLDSSYLASFLSRVAAFSARHRQNIGDFLEWFDEQPTLSAAVSDEIDAVRLLTIHKAKGLEAPAVICPLFFGREYPVEMWVDVEDDGSGHRQLPTAFVSLGATEPTQFEPQRREEQMMAEVDDLNILYVALTRPREQLVVVCPDPHDIKSRRERDLRYPSLLRAYVDHLGLEHESVYEAGEHDFRRVVEAEERGKKRPVGVARLSYDDWTGKAVVASPAEQAVTPLYEEQKRFGIYAHDLLAGVLHAGDAATALERLAAAQNLGDDERQRLQRYVEKVVVHPDAARFFADGVEVRNECDLVVDGKHLRPDRIVMAGDETWVVDFKTGMPMREHRDQVAEYCRAVAALGYPAVSGYLLYLQADISVEKVC